MINYEITSFSTKLMSMQVKYSMEGKPDFFTRMAFNMPITEARIHEIAKRQAIQAEMFWEREQQAETFELENLKGQTKRTVVEPKSDYDPTVEKLVEVVEEDDEFYRIKFVGEPLSEDEIAAMIRNKRDALLRQTDSLALTDRPMTDEVLAYRQALRDLPDQPGFPMDVSWPIMPID